METLSPIYSWYSLEPNQNALPKGKQGSFIEGVSTASSLAIGYAYTRGTQCSYEGACTACTPYSRANRKMFVSNAATSLHNKGLILYLYALLFLLTRYTCT